MSRFWFLNRGINGESWRNQLAMLKLSYIQMRRMLLFMKEENTTVSKTHLNSYLRHLKWQVGQMQSFVNLLHARVRFQVITMVLSGTQAFTHFGWIKVFQQDMSKMVLCILAKQVVLRHKQRTLQQELGAKMQNVRKLSHHR